MLRLRQTVRSRGRFGSAQHDSTLTGFWISVSSTHALISACKVLLCADNGGDMCHNECVEKVADALRKPGSQSPKPGSIRLLATDIDGTLLNPEFQVSDGDL